MPVEMVTPEGVNALAVAVFGTLALALVVAAVVHWLRKGSPLFVFLLLGGALASFSEPICDTLGLCYYPTIDSIEAFHTFGRIVPLWVFFAYIVFYGGLSCLVTVYLRREASRRMLWIGALSIFALDFAIEIPLLHLDLYTYYGYQPLALGGMPLIWLWVNALAVLLTAVVVQKTRSWYEAKRVRMLLAVPLVPVAQFTGFFVAMLSWSTLNTQANHAFLWAAAIGTTILGILIFDALARLASAPSSAPKAVEDLTEVAERADDKRIVLGV
jgi:hypothetical protein